MCGIIACICHDNVVKYLIEGLKILQNRGYDSAGITSVQSNCLITTKYASSGTTSDAINKLEKTSDIHDSCIGIAHTRWATHGGKTDFNAHPHHDQNNRIALVHNGVIENSNELKDELIQKGFIFKSETDTEVIVQLISSYLELDLLEATKKAISRLRGTWGLVIIDKSNPAELIAAKNGSPLLIGQTPDRIFIASEAAAFSRYAKQYVSLENGDVVKIKIGEPLIGKNILLSSEENIQLNPSPFLHWTIKEIFEQPEAISRALNYGGRLIDESSVKLGGLEENKDSLLTIDNLIISACGTSLNAALYGAGLMRYLQCFSSIQVVDSAELTSEYFTQKSGLLVLSQSGETKDVHRALNMAIELNVPVFSVVNSVGSLIALTTKCGVYLNAGREMAVASTKAFVSQVVVLALISVWFSQNRSENQKRRIIVDNLLRLSINFGISLHRVRDQCRKISSDLISSEHLFILGKGLSHSIALEGALKIKEISYIHAEGFSGGALKHGPFALIDLNVRTPVILIVLDDQHFNFMCTAVEEVKARGASTIVITNSHKFKSKVDHIILIPSNDILTPLMAVVPLQLIAYELALLKNIDPDKPRNLAKAVTVD